MTEQINCWPVHIIKRAFATEDAYRDALNSLSDDQLASERAIIGRSWSRSASQTRRLGMIMMLQTRRRYGFTEQH